MQFSASLVSFKKVSQNILAVFSVLSSVNVEFSSSIAHNEQVLRNVAGKDVPSADYKSLILVTKTKCKN